jgi:hypothetical protein
MVDKMKLRISPSILNFLKFSLFYSSNRVSTSVADDDCDDNNNNYPVIMGHTVAQQFDALRYKPECRGCHWNFSRT